MSFSLYLLFAFLGTVSLSAVVIILMRLWVKKADKKLANQLKTSENLNALLNSLNDVIFEFNEDKVCVNVWFNEQVERVVDPRVCLNKKLEEIIGYEKALKFNNALDYVIEHRRPTSLQYISDHGTGAWLMAKATPVFDESGNYLKRISASVTDISEQKKYEDALKEKELLLLEAQHVAKIGNWLYDSKGEIVYLSDSFLNILGVETAPGGLQTFEFYMSLVHPDDQEECRNFLITIATSNLKQYEHRLITPAGELKYIKIVIGDKLLNDEGVLQRIFGIIQDITDIKLSEKIIKRSRAELIEAQTIAKIGNWSWRPSSNKLTYSDELLNIFEVDPNQLIQMAPFKLLLKNTHENDRTIIRELCKKGTVVSGHTCVFRITTPQKKLKYISVIIGKILRNEKGELHKVIGTLQDVTEQKQAELDYERTENKYKRVLEKVKLAAITIDRLGNVIFCNQYLANLLGYEQSEMLEINWFEHFIPADIRQHVSGMIAGDALPNKYTNAIICRDGSERLITWQNTMTRDENGDIDEITGIGEDITEQQRATQELISAKEIAERSSRFKSEFLSTMSHEIRTPMNAVIGTTNLLLNDSPKPEQLEYLNILKFSGENLLAIINDILDYNKIEAGKLELNQIKFDLPQLAQKTRQAFSARAAEKNLHLDLLVDDGIPPVLLGDQVRLSQILNNLISNAIKFTEKGKITLRLQVLRASEKEITVKFIVTDTGIGISPENQSLIFDPFVQDPVVNQPANTGTGLGLAITKRLINLHKSDISVISEEGKGSQFVFVITFVLPEASHPQPEKTVETNNILSMDGMEVLIVDDNKMNLLIASKFLKRWQVNVDEAINGEQAVQIVAKKRYDLIIMDLQMPVMNGFEATQKIREFNTEVPIIALTADAMPETYDKAIACGMNDYLTKPFVPDAFFSMVSSFYKKI
ncbi:PAS domain S-box protein [Mucilaginibacter calamicampi]|uniref:histidine kinase n=1 Tax=Mucilaginibacter calamicampi TaxID=1302352 RepID=A0ABW2YUH9_9SPHI